MQRRIPYGIYITISSLLAITSSTLISKKEILNLLAKNLEQPPLVYREFRNLIEVFAEILLLQQVYVNTLTSLISGLLNIIQRYGIAFDPNYILAYWGELLEHAAYAMFASKEYYNLFSRSPLSIRSIGELKEELAENLLLPVLRSEDIKISKKKLIKNIRTSQLLSLPILLAYSAIKIRGFRDKKMKNEKAKRYAIESNDLLKRSIAANMLHIISGLINDMKLDEDTVRNIYNLILERIDNTINEVHLYVPLLTPSALLQFLGSLSDSLRNLERKYDDYSFFVHGYLSGHQMLTYTSILEYMVLCSEVSKMFNTISDCSNLLKDSFRKLEENVTLLGYVVQPLSRS
jgi:hypothetical protein